MTIELSFIIPNYKSERCLASCIASIAQHSRKDNYEIIIVNNDVEPIGTQYGIENVRILNNKANAGFSNACNLGAGIANGGVLFFLNPDTEIKSGDISDLLSALEDSSVGIVAPRLVLPSGDVQPWCCGYEINLWDIIKNNFGFTRSKQLWKKNEDVTANWVSGAGLLVKKSLFVNIGGFDENFFMYFEDVDLCKRILSLGKSIRVLSSVQILHFGGQSLSDNKKKKEIYYASQDYYFKKHFGLFQLFLLKILRQGSIFFCSKSINKS